MNSFDIDGLIAKYDYPVPRYTSFPTAVQFKECFSQDVYDTCLDRIDDGESISIYIHIPFCHRLCHYCGCHTKIVNSYGPIGSYVSTLIRELDIVGGRLLQKGKSLSVSRIHFGGGSPNYVRASDLERVLLRLSDYFDMSEVQIDMECDPRLFSKEKVREYVDIGLSRISLGIQDFDERVQEVINRKQPYDFVKEQLEYLRETGLLNINFDLIIGLPEQTMESLQESVDRVLSLRPCRIAVFPYAHVPWMKKHQKLLEGYKFPDERSRFDMGLLVKERLLGGGYKAIGIDHYALEKDSLFEAYKRGKVRRNFQGYTDDLSRTILGLGLSSISHFEDAYIQNTTEAPLYRGEIESDRLPISRFLELTEEDRRRRDLIEQIMCNFRVDFADFDIEVPYDLLSDLDADGIIELDESCLRVTEFGKSFTRIVASYFDPYFSRGGEGRHSKSI